MHRRDKQELFRLRTGTPWADAVAVWGRLQQESVDAHARYMTALGSSLAEDEAALEHDMRMKFEDANAHWTHIWTELHGANNGSEP